MRVSTASAPAGAALVLLLALTPDARADLIIQPVAASTDMGTLLGNIDNIRNQNVLSIPYAHLLTDFQAYAALDPRDSELGATSGWASASGTPTGQVALDLGQAYTIQTLGLWNGNAGVGVNEFGLYADDDGVFGAGSELLGVFNAAMDPITGTGNVLQTFGFTPTETRYVIVDIRSNHGLTASQIMEVAFERGTPIPEPSALVLLGAGAFGVGGYGWRLRKRAGA